jgi:two-component system alkaline phosphatase synthesis response regulator PhoP
MARILVIEDDPTILKLLAGDLELEGFSVLTARDGEEGLERAKTSRPDLLILDVMMPKMNGYDVCRALRKDGSDVPIIMLTARGQEAEKVVGLNQGADDYVTKPYGAMELMARVHALLRRHKRVLDKVEQTSFGDVTVDFRRMEATRHGKPLALTAKEFQMLELLIRHRGEVVSRQQFLEEVWGYEEMPSTRTVDNRLVTLRQKLDPQDPEAYIATIHGVGYKFVA